MAPITLLEQGGGSLSLRSSDGIVHLLKREWDVYS